MSGASLVYVSRRALTMQPPGRVMYHLVDHLSWPRTVCGRLEGDRLVASRLDTAALIGVPCPTCHEGTIR